MGINITRDLYQRHDPLEWDDEKIAECVAKHGVRPALCNRKWRDNRRGWGALDPIPTSDPRFNDVYAALKNKPRDPKRKARDGYYHQGDLVLSIQPQEEWEISQARRTYLANRRMRFLRDGNPVEAELARETHTEGIEVPRPRIKHVDKQGHDMFPDDDDADGYAPRGRPGHAARGFVLPPEEPQISAIQNPIEKPRRRGRPPGSKNKTTRKTTRKRARARSAD